MMAVYARGRGRGDYKETMDRNIARACRRLIVCAAGTGSLSYHMWVEYIVRRWNSKFGKRKERETCSL